MSYADLKDKSVIVTAAGNGIGKASAIAFAKEGAKVIVNDLNESLADTTMHAIAEFDGTAVKVIGDVTDFETVKALVERAKTDHGRLDVMFSVAGGAFPMPFDSTDVDMDHQILALNLNSAIYGAKAALPVMLEQGRGVIMNTSSGAGLGAVRGLATYGAAKAGVQALSKSIAAEYGQRGIRAITIAPGAMDTPGLRAWADTLDGGFEGFNAKQPSGRCGTAEEIAKAAVFLASDSASFINGNTIPVDGAVHAILAAPV